MKNGLTYSDLIYGHLKHYAVAVENSKLASSIRRIKVSESMSIASIQRNSVTLWRDDWRIRGGAIFRW